jgi:hypothetical protein
MDMSSRSSKIIIGIIIIVVVVGLIVIFGSKNSPQPNEVGSVQKSENQQDPEKVKEDLINDDMSNPAVSSDDIENEDFNPALDDATPDPNVDNPDDIIEDPEAENL